MHLTNVQNIARNGSHYSSLKWLGPSAIDYVAEILGSGVYFNTLVPFQPGILIKYGVVRLDTLQRDLLQWNSLYIAGRLHKPVQTLITDPQIAAAQSLNLESALRTALLLLEDETFSLRQLLRVLCGLSYEGDLRMGLAEDSRKVERIVTGSYRGLSELYQPALTVAEAEWKILQRESAGSEYFTQDMSIAARAPLLAALPASLLSKIATSVGRSAPVHILSSDPAARAVLARDLAGYSKCGAVLRKSLASTVRVSSLRQVVAGAVSAGAVKSVRYAWRKLNKANSSGGDAISRVLS